MLKASFFIESVGAIVGFDISGHSGYSEVGTDIVCAAVSSAAYMVVNTITEVMGADVDVLIEEKSGHMKAVVSKRDAHLCADIFAGFKAHLILLEKIYPKNIKVSYAEVESNAKY